jgi:hypothetical protein
MGEEDMETGVESSRFVGKGSCEIFSAGSGMFACAIAAGQQPEPRGPRGCAQIDHSWEILLAVPK